MDGLNLPSIELDDTWYNLNPMGIAGEKRSQKPGVRSSRQQAWGTVKVTA
jgi:hypothetical protein